MASIRSSRSLNVNASRPLTNIAARFDTTSDVDGDSTTSRAASVVGCALGLPRCAGATLPRSKVSDT